MHNRADQLPIHPTKTHPHTGAPLRAIYVSPKAGRVYWPILGASPDDDKGGGSGDDGKGGDDGKKGDDKGGDGSDDKGGGTGDDGDRKQQKVNEAGNAIDDQGRDLGYPGNTPVKDMRPEQQSAYHAAQSRKHETRNREWLGMFDGKKPEEVKAELTKLRRDAMTEEERRSEDAKRGGATEASRKAARGMLELALDHVDEERRTLLVSTTDVTSVIDENGEIDTGKVKRLAQALAPSDKGSGDSQDLGQGRRGSHSTGGTAAGKSLFEQRRKKSRSSTSD